jgi:hypothetical protein
MSLTAEDFQHAGNAEWPASQQAAEDAVADAIKTKLRDPDSAKFKFAPARPGIAYVAPSLKVTGVLMCGFVNSKNGYGGYVGDTPFFASIVTHNGRSAAVVTVDEVSSHVALKLCGSIVAA